jgi:hypothetical protein
MAVLTPAEFNEAVATLAESLGVPRLRDRLAAVGAFTSRRGLNTAGAIAERLYRLSGGLRLQVPATYAFTSLWSEVVTGSVGEEGEKKLEGLAEQVNACLGDGDAIVAGKEEELDRALGAYRDALADAIGPSRARLDMLLKAVPAVADRLRAAPVAAAPPAEPPSDA